jgi:hypothetical protein
LGILTDRCHSVSRSIYRKGRWIFSSSRSSPWGRATAGRFSERLHQLSSEMLQIKQGSLYPALHRLERQKAIAASWETSDNKQRVRVYRLTPHGKRLLASEQSRWRQLSHAIASVLSRPVREET